MIEVDEPQIVTSSLEQSGAQNDRGRRVKLEFIFFGDETASFWVP